MKQVPRVAGLVRDVALVLPDLPIGPSMSSKLIPDEAPVGRALTEALSRRACRCQGRSRGLPDLSSEELAFWPRPAIRRSFPQAYRRAGRSGTGNRKTFPEGGHQRGDGTYVNEVDLGNGHRWKSSQWNLVPVLKSPHQLHRADPRARPPGAGDRGGVCGQEEQPARPVFQLGGKQGRRQG